MEQEWAPLGDRFALEARYAIGCPATITSGCSEGSIQGREMTGQVGHYQSKRRGWENHYQH